ncbi:MAG: pantoate--beta-alanine ligase [Pseudomonadota bacterium]
MHVVRTVQELRAVQAELRNHKRTSCLVPTMGALHTGHLSLVTYAREHADEAIATLFVNPTQFGPNEDLDRYPRQEAKDLATFEDNGVHAVFVPTVQEIYGPGDATTVSMAGPALGLEADHRPHFFSGVATVVSRLLLAALSDMAVFGEKDYQQLQVIRRMVADLNIPTIIHGAPTVREPDGLALSSRNAYLSADERAIAPMLHATLQRVRERLQSGEDVDRALTEGLERLTSAGFKPDYLSARDGETLGPLKQVARGRLLAAAWLGTTRLIDNVALA